MAHIKHGFSNILIFDILARFVRKKQKSVGTNLCDGGKVVLRPVINKDLEPFRSTVQIFENVNFDAHTGYLIENSKTPLRRPYNVGCQPS